MGQCSGKSNNSKNNTKNQTTKQNKYIIDNKNDNPPDNCSQINQNTDTTTKTPNQQQQLQQSKTQQKDQQSKKNQNNHSNGDLQKQDDQDQEDIREKSSQYGATSLEKNNQLFVSNSNNPRNNLDSVTESKNGTYTVPLKPDEEVSNQIREQAKTIFDKQILKEEQDYLNENADGYFSAEELKHYDGIKKQEKIKNEKIKVEQEKNKKSGNKQQKIRWKEGEHLGSGSFGKVIIGMNLDTGELMAVKQINRRDIPFYNEEEKKEMLEALELEIELLKDLQHDNIVKYMGTTKSKDKDTLNIFLEYVAQGSISFLLEKYGKFKEQLTRAYMQKILEGLEYLHYNNVVHRDLKGANVLVDNNGVCKLADFGSCKKMVSQKKEGQLEQIKGTVNWMAPEVIKQQECSRFSDIWSIGCTLLEMLTGKIPYYQYTNIYTAMYQIGKGLAPPEIPDELSDEAKDFLQQCFKIQPRERPNVCKLLQHPFIQNNNLPRGSGIIQEQRPINNNKRISRGNLYLNVNQDGKQEPAQVSPSGSVQTKNILFSIRDLGPPEGKQGENKRRPHKRKTTKKLSQNPRSPNRKPTYKSKNGTLIIPQSSKNIKEKQDNLQQLQHTDSNPPIKQRQNSQNSKFSPRRRQSVSQKDILRNQDVVLEPQSSANIQEQYQLKIIDTNNKQQEVVSSPVRAPPIENLNNIDNQSNGDIDDDDLYYQGLSGTKINDVNRNIDQNVSRKKINQ